MDLRRIILKETEDFEWIKQTPDIVTWDKLNVGDKVELIYVGQVNKAFSNSLDGAKGIVTRLGTNDMSLIVKYSADPNMVTLKNNFSNTYRFKLLDNDTELDPRIIRASNRVIKESEDFEWIQDVKPFELPDKWVIKNDTDDEDNWTGYDIQRWLFDQGWSWDMGDKAYEYLHEENLYFFADDSEEKKFDAYSGWNHSLQVMIDEYGYHIYDWSEIESNLT